MYLCTQNYDLKRGGTFETAMAGTFHSVTAGTSIPLFTPDDDNIYWHHRHRNAVIGEYSNSGNKLIIAAIQKFPECKEAFEELLNLQKFSSFRDMNLSNSKFVKMALESQHS